MDMVVWPIEPAQLAFSKWGVPASITLAQWALESGYGRHMPQGSNNPFGIKAIGSQPFVGVRTREVYQGSEVFIIGKFRKFASLAEAFDAHARLLAVGKPYQGIKQFIKDPLLYCMKLTGIYATDPQYGILLGRIINDHDLLQYDIKKEPQAPVAIVTATAVVLPTAAVISHIGSHFDWHTPAAFAIGVLSGAMLVSVFALSKLAALRSDSRSGDGDDDMVRAEMQPLIDYVAALKAKADAGQTSSDQAALDAANAKAAELQTELDKANGDLQAANAHVATMTTDQADTDAALKQAAGFVDPSTPIADPGAPVI